MEVFSPLQHNCFHGSLLLDCKSLRNLYNTYKWIDGLLEQASEICIFKKGFGQNVFHEEIFFWGKRIYFPTFSSHTLINLFYKSYNMLKFLRLLKKYLRSDGGGERGYPKNVRVYVSLFLKEYFHIFTAYFCFSLL